MLPNLKNLPDDEIMLLLQQTRDTRLIGILFQRYLPELRRWGLRWLQDESLTQDVIQETFRRVCQYYPLFRHQGSVIFWIRRIFFNALKNHWRGQNRKTLDLFHTHPSHSQSPDQKILDDELNQLIAKAVETLPKQQRLVFEKRWYQDMELSQIASWLNISYDTAKSHWRLAVAKINKWLSRNGWYLPVPQFTVLRR